MYQNEIFQQLLMRIVNYTLNCKIVLQIGHDLTLPLPRLARSPTGFSSIMFDRQEIETEINKS